LSRHRAWGSWDRLLNHGDVSQFQFRYESERGGCEAEFRRHASWIEVGRFGIAGRGPR
jgi:hypothetical protein